MSHSLVDLPADVLRDPLLGILRARLAREDLISLASTCQAFAILLRPFIFESLTFRGRGPSAKDRATSLAGAATLTPLVQRLVFEPAYTEEDDGDDGADFWTAFTHLVPNLVGLKSITCRDGAMPSEDFWVALRTSGNVNPSTIEVENAFIDSNEPPPAFFTIRGLSTLRFVGDDGYRQGFRPRGPSADVMTLVFRNRHTLERLTVHSRTLTFDKILTPSADEAHAPTFPALCMLDLTANCGNVWFASDELAAFVEWTQGLLVHLPELETLILHPGMDTARSHDGDSVRAHGSSILTLIGASGMPFVYNTAQIAPLSETTLLPRLLTSKTVEHLQRVRKLVLMRPPSMDEHGDPDVEFVPLGRKDIFDLFPAIRALGALEELSLTLGEVDVEMLAGLADAVKDGKLRSLEIDLRLPSNRFKREAGGVEGDGLLWANELHPLAAALSPLARTLLSLTVADNRATSARSLLFDGDVPYTPAGDTFNFEPTLVTFARQLWNLTSVRWVTRDGRDEDALVRDQLWVVAVGGGWMRLVG